MARRPFLFVVFVLVAAACGGSNATQQPSNSAAATSTTAVTTTSTTTTPATTSSTTATSTTTTTTEAPVGFACRATAGEPAVEDPDAVPGTERTDEFGVVQVWVPAGSFTMGTADTAGLEPPSWATAELAGEQPAHEVTISTGFWVDKYEVSVEAFKAFDAAGGYDDQACWSEDGWKFRDRVGINIRTSCEFASGDLPMACVSWFEAEAYAIWRGAALPTEAQWEYAARGPDSLVYPWGQEWDPERANVVGAAGTVAVDTHENGASWVGAHHMSGNVMEWVADWLSFTYYESSPSVDPTGPEEGRIKVEKGGWWGNVPYVARAAYRHFEDPPTYRDVHIGFRVVSR